MNCKNCGYENFKERKDGLSYGFCGTDACIVARSLWMKKNWDQLPDSNFKKKYESEFWEVTPEQKKQFATFFALVRPKKKRPDRNCFQCGKKIGKGASPFDIDNRMCSPCEFKVSRFGALASS